MLLSVACLCLLANNSGAQTITRPENSVKSKNIGNICHLFSDTEEIEEQAVEVLPPIRRLGGEQRTTIAFTSTEIEFYQSLGLIKNQDGSYTCIAIDPDNSRRRFTLFKVQKVNGVVVISTFLDEGMFMSGQQEASTNLFLEMIRFYTDIPNQYYTGIKNYFQEFYVRIADGRIKPSNERIYHVDEPEATVILYHPLQGNLKGTGLSLNIPLD